jgi:pterin-4a-carbinolamine dehydratase
MGQVDPARQPFAFISYRREDSALAARYICEMICRQFGTTSVFLDVEGIDSGEEFPARIMTELERATVVLALIGPHWLAVTDKYGRRRIDKPDDWVRQELTYALQRCVVIPTLLLETPLPDREALDDALVSLRTRQVLKLRDDTWHDDLIRLMSRLEDLGFARQTEYPLRYPTPQVQVRELAALELRNVLDTLPDWQARPNERRGSELFKSYEFVSFKDAMGFMHAATPHISKVQHHPRWTNMWRTVTVSLTTWDIGSRISPLDVDLARYLDELRERWPLANR